VLQAGHQPPAKRPANWRTALFIVEFVIQQKAINFNSSAPAYSDKESLLKIIPVTLAVKTIKLKA